MSFYLNWKIQQRVWILEKYHAFCSHQPIIESGTCNFVVWNMCTGIPVLILSGSTRVKAPLPPSAPQYLWWGPGILYLVVPSLFPSARWPLRFLRVEAGLEWQQAALCGQVPRATSGMFLLCSLMTGCCEKLYFSFSCKEPRLQVRNCICDSSCVHHETTDTKIEVCHGDCHLCQEFLFLYQMDFPGCYLFLF